MNKQNTLIIETLNSDIEFFTQCIEGLNLNVDVFSEFPQKLNNSEYQLIIFCIDDFGFDNFLKLREKYQCPIIITSAYNCNETQIKVFEIGADEYIVKATNIHIIRARLKIALRNHLKNSTLNNQNYPRFKIGKLSLDLLYLQINYEKQKLNLTIIEFKILSTLILQQDKIVSRNELYQRCLNKEFDGFDRIIDCRVSNIRKKFSAANIPIKGLKTIRASGYQFISSAW